MPKLIVAIPVPVAVGNGTAVPVGDYSRLGFPVLSTLTAGTVQFQESHDGGVSWRNVGAALAALGTADTKFSNEASHVRCNVTVGTPTATANTTGIPFPG